MAAVEFTPTHWVINKNKNKTEQGLVERLNLERALCTDMEDVSLVFVDTSGNLEKAGPQLWRRKHLIVPWRHWFVLKQEKNSQRYF